LLPCGFVHQEGEPANRATGVQDQRRNVTKREISGKRSQTRKWRVSQQKVWGRCNRRSEEGEKSAKEKGENNMIIKRGERKKGELSQGDRSTCERETASPHPQLKEGNRRRGGNGRPGRIGNWLDEGGGGRDVTRKVIQSCRVGLPEWWGKGGRETKGKEKSGYSGSSSGNRVHSVVTGFGKGNKKRGGPRGGDNKKGEDGGAGSLFRPTYQRVRRGRK